MTVAGLTYGERGRKDDVFGRAAQRAHCDDGFHWDGQYLMRGGGGKLLSEGKSNFLPIGATPDEEEEGKSATELREVVFQAHGWRHVFTNATI